MKHDSNDGPSCSKGVSGGQESRQKLLSIIQVLKVGD